jgi:hypothetical protein
MNPYQVPELTITPHETEPGRFHFRGRLSGIQINASNYAAFKNKKTLGGEESKESEDQIIKRILTYNPGATERNITAHLEDKFQKEVAAAAAPIPTPTPSAAAAKARKTRKNRR